MPFESVPCQKCNGTVACCKNLTHLTHLIKLRFCDWCAKCANIWHFLYLTHLLWMLRSKKSKPTLFLHINNGKMICIIII